MPIVQVNVWICEKCGVTASTTEKTSPYHDPVVCPPAAGWNVQANDLLCPECMSDERE